jgi:hypothetical protein
LCVDNVDKDLIEGLMLASPRVALRPRRNGEISGLNIGLSAGTPAAASGTERRCLDKRLTAVKHVHNLWKRISIGESALRAQSSGDRPKVE